MTILSVVKDVCATVGVMVPTSLFSGISTNRTAQEMLALANEMAQRIAFDTRDWVMLRDVMNMTGDGVAISFPFPANYRRLLLTSNLRISTSPHQPLTFVPDIDKWNENRLAGDTSSGFGEWIISGSPGGLAIFIYPVLGVGATASIPYLQNSCVILESGGVSDRFMADADRFSLDERLLKLGMIWQWKAQKGSPYAEDMGSYSDALQIAMGKDSPSPAIIDRMPVSAYARVAYPWPVPT